MIFNKFRNDGSLTLQDLFSEEMIQKSLEALTWTHAENERNEAWELVMFKNIESEILRMAISNLQKRKRRGSYLYSIFNNRIERTGESIKPKGKFHPELKFSKVFKEILKPIEKVKGYTVVK